MAEAASHSIASDEGLSASGSRAADADAPATNNDELASSVDALLSQIEESCERVQQELAGASAPVPPSAAAHQTPTSTPAPTADTGPAQVESATAPQPAPQPAPQRSPQPAPGAAEIGSLDEELSRLAESMLAEPEFGGAPRDSAPPAPEPDAETQSAENQPEADPSPAANVDNTAAPANPPPAPPPPPAIAPKPAPPPANIAPRTAANPTPIPAPDIASILTPDLDSRPRAHLGAIVVGLAHRAAELASAPLNGKPRVVRDSVGWVAVCTMFMAGCLWAAVLLRSPYSPTPASEPTSLDQPAQRHGSSAAQVDGVGETAEHPVAPAASDKPAGPPAPRHESTLGGSKAASGASKAAQGKDANHPEAKTSKPAAAAKGPEADHKPEHH